MSKHFIPSLFKCHAIYEMMLQNVVKSEGLQTIWRMRVACCLSKATRAKAHACARVPTPTRTNAHAYTYAFSLSLSLFAFPRQE